MTQDQLTADLIREACAKIAETPIVGEQDDITMEAKYRVAAAIRSTIQDPEAVEATVRDAERYRWLRSEEFYVRDGEHFPNELLCCELERKEQKVFWGEEELDAAIDAARKSVRG